MAKSIEMNYKESSAYEVIYPQTTTNEVIDIHEYVVNITNGQIEGIIPNPYGVIKIKAVDSEGNPARIQLLVSPQINNGDNVVTDNTSGYFIAYVNPGTYVLTVPENSAFVNYEIDNPNCVVNVNKVSEVNVTVSIVQSGEMEITSSQQIVFPENFPYNIDIWCCGGGCSGWAYKMVTWGGFRVVAGFGQPGAYCNQLNNYQVSGKTLNINIGSGGVSSNQITEQIGQGGNTSITVDSYNILSGTGAKNKGGFALDSNRANPGTGLAGNGGTGAGLADISYGSSYGYAENGLINGATSSHYIAVTNPYGQGDGKDKHIFGDSNRTLCCSSSGGVACEYQGRVLIGSPGSGAGTNTVLSSFSGSGQEIKAGDAVTWGSSGGNCFVDGSGSFSCQSGAGKQGVVYIRWPSQSQ